MYCESCGKKLIRGYQFCMECGTPVPPNADDEDAQTPQAGDSAAQTETTDALNPDVGVTMPGIQPVNSDGGSLVFCTNCGMHMQTSTDFCDKCGKPLGNKSNNPAPNGGVPLFNANPLGDEFGDISEGDIDEINSFMNGLGGIGGLSSGIGAGIPISSDPASSSGDMGVIGGKSTADDLEQLTQQLASFGASASDMPAIGIQPVEPEMRQAEPKPGETREMENFSMEGPAYSTAGLPGDVPVIEVGSMDENPAEDVSLDPYAFVNNILTNDPVLAAPVPTPAPVAEPVAEISEPEPTIDDILNSLQNAAPAPAEEPAAPVEETAAPVEEIAAPVAEEPAISEPVAEVYEEPEDEGFSPIYEPEPVSSYQPPVMETAPFIEEGAPVIAEGAGFMAPPAAEEPAAPAEIPQPVSQAAEEPVIAQSQPQPQPEPIPVARPAANKKPADVDPVLGKLSYCRNCGQDMYENEPACKNCGAPYRAPKKHDTSLDKKGGAAPAGEKKGISKYVPFIVGGATVAAIIIGVIVTTPKKNDTPAITGNETLSVTTPATTTANDPVDDEPDNGQLPAGAATAEENVPEDTVTPAPDDVAGNSEETYPEKPVTADEAPSGDGSDSAEPDDSSNDAPGVTSDSNGAGTVTKPANDNGSVTTKKPSTTTKRSNTTTTKKPTTTTKKPTITTTKKPTTTTTRKPTTTTTTRKPTTTTTRKPATTKLQEVITAANVSVDKDRDAIMDAVAVICGEVGKIDTLAQNVIYAMENSTGNAETARITYMNRDFSKNLMSSIESGKSAVDSAVAKAKPKNSSLNSMYDSLLALQKKYMAYYNFMKSPSGNTSKFTSSCSTYMSDVTTAVNGFKYTKFTSSYGEGEVNAAYKSAMSDAMTAANNAVSAFSTLQTKLSAVGNSGFDNAAVKELSTAANSKTLAQAVAYAQEVAAYRTMLASAPAAYSAAYNNLKTISDNLNTLVDIYNMIQEHDLSSYKSESSTCISAAKTAITACTKAIS